MSDVYRQVGDPSGLGPRERDPATGRLSGGRERKHRGLAAGTPGTPAPPGAAPEPASPAPDRPRRQLVIAGVVIALLLIAGGAALAIGGGGDEGSTTTTTDPTKSEPTTEGPSAEQCTALREAELDDIPALFSADVRAEIEEWVQAVQSAQEASEVPPSPARVQELIDRCTEAFPVETTVPSGPATFEFVRIEGSFPNFEFFVSGECGNGEPPTNVEFIDPVGGLAGSPPVIPATTSGDLFVVPYRLPGDGAQGLPGDQAVLEQVLVEMDMPGGMQGTCG